MAPTESELQNWEFDIALSFSGEHRSFVSALNNRLNDLGVKVFYDEEFEAEIGGENLYDYLQETYHNKARFGTYLLPVRLDQPHRRLLRPRFHDLWRSLS